MSDRAHASITAVILAAGRSSRLGFPKALAPVGEERLLERVVRLSREAGLEVVVVLGFHEDRIRRSLPGLLGTLVTNPAPHDGQTSSLKVGLREIAGRGSACLWPVDHGRIEAMTLTRLRDRFEARGDATHIVAPSDGRRRGHPVLITATVVEEMLALDDTEPAYRVIRKDPSRVDHVEIDDPFILRDLDTPEDLEGPS